MIDAYVTLYPLDNIILGRNFIQRYPKLLFKILHDNVPSQVKLQVVTERKIMNLKAEKLLKTYEEIFSDEITADILCTRTTHRIDTGDAKPRRQYNGRIPINIDKLVSAEMIICFHEVSYRHQTANGVAELCRLSRKMGSLDCALTFGILMPSQRKKRTRYLV